MAGSLNKVILVGHLGQDPKISYAQSGLPIANMRLATSERIRDKDGQFTERTDWHTIVTFDKQADFCGKYLGKGSLIMVEGRLQTQQGGQQGGYGGGQQGGGQKPPFHDEEDLGPAFPSEASGMDDVPF